MSEDDKTDRTYGLPTPDLSAFGAPGTADERSAAEPFADGQHGDEQHGDEQHGDEPHGGRHDEPRHDGSHGTMRFQDPASTHPRPPTLAEQRARAQAEEELAQQQAAAYEKSAGRRKVMIGAGVTVGVVALVGAWYLLASPATVTAQCTVAGTGTDADTVVADQNCDPDYATSHGGYINNGFVFLPLPGAAVVVVVLPVAAAGGSFTAPSDETVKTNSGKTIQRGGFGITGKSGGSSGGGSDGGGEEGGRSGGS